MTDLERLLLHAQEQSIALAKATQMLVAAAQALELAGKTIQHQQGLIEGLQLDLAEARLGRAVRQ